MLQLVTSCYLIRCDRVTHICVSKPTITSSDNGLALARRQAIIWTIAGILLIGPLGTNFSELVIEIHTFSFKKMQLKMSSEKWRSFCLGLNVFWRSLGLSSGVTEATLGNPYTLERFTTENGEVYRFSVTIKSHDIVWRAFVCVYLG